MDTAQETIGVAVGMIPSGCSILTVADGDRRTGMLVSWVQQVSFEPPAVSVCVKRGRPAEDLIDAAGRFVLNIVGENPTPMFKHFGKGFGLDEDAFEGVDVASSDHGPVLTACVGQLGCRVTDKVSTGDHDLYVATVEAAAATPNARPYVHLRKSGLAY